MKHEVPREGSVHFTYYELQAKNSFEWHPVSPTCLDKAYERLRVAGLAGFSTHADAIQAYNSVLFLSDMYTPATLRITMVETMHVVRVVEETLYG